MPVENLNLPLPTSDEIEIADYLIGSYRSELDAMVSRLEAINNPITPEEYLELCEQGYEFKSSAYDPNLVREIIVFAIEAIKDAHWIQEDAEKLQAAALGILHGVGVDDQYRERIRRWHEERGTVDQGGDEAA